MISTNSLQRITMLLLFYALVIVFPLGFLRQYFKNKSGKEVCKQLWNLAIKPIILLWHEELLLLKAFYFALITMFAILLFLLASLKTPLPQSIYLWLSSMVLLYILGSTILMSLKWFLDYIFESSLWQILSYAFIVPSIAISFIFSPFFTNQNFFYRLPVIAGLIISHIIAVRGLLLVASKTTLLFPNSDKMESYKWYSKYVAMSVWFVTIVQILYSETLLTWKLDPNSFEHPKAINAQRLIYFVIGTFTTLGSNFTPTDKWGRLVTIAITLTSVIFLIVFLGTVLPIQNPVPEKRNIDPS